MPEPKDKPFAIPKLMVWEACPRVLVPELVADPVDREYERPDEHEHGDPILGLIPCLRRNPKESPPRSPYAP
jgi:hypothetical protein